MRLEFAGSAIVAHSMTVGLGDVEIESGAESEVLGLTVGNGTENCHVLLTPDMAWRMVTLLLDGLSSSGDHTISERAMEARLALKRLGQ